MRLAAAAITHRLPLYRQPFVYYPASHSISRPLISSSLRLASTAALPVEALQHDAPVYTNVTSRDISEHISLLENSISGDHYWSDRLREALQDSQTRSKRVSIYGDTLAAPDDIVSALLRTPFSDESAILSFISERKTAPGSSDILKFEFRSSVNRDANRLGLPSGWLRQSGVDLYELTGANALPHLLRSDVVAIVVDPYRLLDVDHVREIPLPILQKSTIIVNGYLPSTHTSETVSSRLRQWLGPTFNGNIVFCNAQLATQAYDILQSGGPSPSPYIVTSYQKLFLASGIGLAQRDLAEAAEHARRPSDTVLQLARRYARDRIKSDTESAQHMLQTVRELRTASHVAATRASHLSVATKQIAGGRIQGSVGSSKSETAARVQSLFQHRLSWLSLLFRLRVDDVSSELEREVGRAFMDVEQQLVYEAGQLYQLQQHLSQKADKVIRRADHPFSSAVLTNRLSTLSLSIPAVESHTLIEPIQRRRAQLVGDIIPLLHAKARWIFYQTYMGAAGGVAASWAAYVPPLEIISSSTAVGLGILSVVASLWSGQARWHRSQKAFWHSWDRCSDMLALDIKAAFASTVEAFVVAKPNAAAEALEQLVQKRLTSLGSIEDRINNINPDKT